jgi:hypothetical protein
MAKEPTKDAPVETGSDPNVPTPVADPVPQAAQERDERIVKTAADIQLDREKDLQQQRLAYDDAMRSKLPKVKMVCISAFTLVDDANPRGRTVQVGETIEVSEYDVQAYTGRCRLPADPLAPDQLAGPNVTRS